MKFICRKNIQIGVNKTIKSNAVRILDLLEADVQVPIDNHSINGAKLTSIKQLNMTIKSKEDFKTPMVCSADLITNTTEVPYYVATFFN